MTAMRIGVVAERSGTSTPTIRYYESIGLLPQPDRAGSGQRTYADADVERLVFIRRCRDFGFSIEQVRALVALASDSRRSCDEVRQIAESHLRSIRAKLAELRALERSISKFAVSCVDDCAGGPGVACVPLRALARRTS